MGYGQLLHNYVTFQLPGLAGNTSNQHTVSSSLLLGILPYLIMDTSCLATNSLAIPQLAGLLIVTIPPIYSC